jgi:dynactin complex subunit
MSSGRIRQSPKDESGSSRKQRRSRKFETPRKLITEFLAAENPQSLIKPVVQERQVKKRQSSGSVMKQTKRTVPKKRRRSSVSRKTPRTLMRQIIEKDSPVKKLEAQKKVIQANLEQPPHSILKYCSCVR